MDQQQQLHCGRATNNRFFSCPPLMADGRAFTDYRPKGVQALQDIVPLSKGSYELRQHMEAHGNDLIDRARSATYATNSCGPCKPPYARGTLLPERTTEGCSQNACVFRETDPDGIGMGRDFGAYGGDDHAYAAFLHTKDAEQAALAEPPCAHAFDPFNEFPLPFDMAHRDGARRLVSPEGGSDV